MSNRIAASTGPDAGDASPVMYCLPHAGGGRSLYWGWADGLPGVDVHPVELPGRDSRFGEPAFTRAEPLVNWLLAGIIAQGRATVALFGHSMGAIIAFELARRLSSAGRECVHLFVSGCSAPHISRPADDTHLLSDGPFLDRIRQLGGTPAELFQDPELRACFLPVLRADYEVVGTYQYRAGRTLTCPVTALAASRDPAVLPTAAAAWRQLTSGPFELQMFSGGHFFVRDQRECVLALIARRLEVRIE